MYPQSAQFNLRVVNTLSGGWEEQLQSAADSWRNFVVVFGPSASGMADVVKRVATVSEPEKLERWSVYSIRDGLDENQFKGLLDADKEQRQIFFFEQLFLLQNRPPRVKNYIVACPLRGIFSDHETEEAAYAALHQHLAMFARAGVVTLAGLYKWRQSSWQPIRRW